MIGSQALMARRLSKRAIEEVNQKSKCIVRVMEPLTDTYPKPQPGSRDKRALGGPSDRRGKEGGNTS